MRTSAARAPWSVRTDQAVNRTWAFGMYADTLVVIWYALNGNHQQVIAERRATYACIAGLARPAPGKIAPRLWLAGDYTDPEFPATLEAATRSGVAAARALLQASA